MIAESPDDVTAFETIDEAIAIALSEVNRDGGVVVIHAADCAIGDHEDECDCVPLELKRGAEA